MWSTVPRRKTRNGTPAVPESGEDYHHFNIRSATSPCVTSHLMAKIVWNVIKHAMVLDPCSEFSYNISW